MIDTDRYENITPERWTVDEDDPFRVVDVQDCTIARTDFVGIHEEREWHLANARLIADAPFLLAEATLRLEEVKRLRVQGRKLVEAAERVRSDISDQDTGWYYQLGNHIEKMNRLVSE
tara:strand:- start:281 stop:634 length:354 start_codon:yes stop_codon:yes gene_type:complete